MPAGARPDRASAPVSPLPSKKVRCAVERTQTTLFRLHQQDIYCPLLPSSLPSCERRPEYAARRHPCDCSRRLQI